VRQIVTGALAISAGGVAVVDEASIDRLGGEDGKSLQLAHFGDTERDSSKGLASRLQADIESGKISADGGDEIMLVARKSGQLIYIPLGDKAGEGEEPKDPEPEDPNKDCRHPGSSDGGGVVAGEGSGGGDGSGGAGGGSMGGVAAGGDTHAGSNNCCGK
jgi:hypothetical protein